MRVGQTDQDLDVKARLTQTENSYFNNYQHIPEHQSGPIPSYASHGRAGSPLFQLQWDDGDEPEGSMTIELLPSDAYRIDPASIHRHVQPSSTTTPPPPCR